MEEKLKPGFFYGSAIAALVGLLFGLLLHIPWEKHPGGPRILFSTAEAAEPVRSDATDSPASRLETSPTAVDDDDTGPVPADPLPVTRLNPGMFNVQPAADEARREDVDDSVAADASQASARGLD
jgi:hypothetical protein